MRTKLLCVALLFGLLFNAGVAMAKNKAEAEITLKEAALVLERLTTQGDRSIPDDLLKQAKAVAIFPGMLKGGFIVGGTYGTGVISARQADGSWSAPAFYEMGGASLGFQIGGQSVDLILVVMKQRGLDGLLKNQVKFGADMAVVAGPVGRRGEAAVSGVSPHADVYSYSASKGLFAGVSLEGAGLGLDAETNRAYYGAGHDARGILLEGKVAPTGTARVLVDALGRHAR